MSVRVRVTLAFSAAMALVLAAVGLFVYLQLGEQLEHTLDSGLAGRADDIAALVSQSHTRFGGPRGPLADPSDNFAQILDGRGRVLDSARGLGSRSLLTASEVGAASTGSLHVTHRHSPPDDDSVRLFAESTRASGRTLIIVVGSSLERSEDARHDVGGLLVLGLPFALLLAAVVGYAAISAALRPVEKMRTRAAVLSSSGDERLPVPRSHDEIARLGTTLNAMLDRLDATYKREQQFVSDASHELRTPLAILKAELELALRDGTTTTEYRAAIESAAEETDRVVQLAEDLLVLARADQGQLPMRRQAIAVEQIFEDVCGRFARRAGDAGITLRAHADGMWLRGDLRLIEQALGNLVDNAIRHARSCVELRAGSGSLTVADDGDGFPSEFLPTAFERFTRADHARGRGGTGLGLAMVQAIAHAHHGAASAGNSHPGAWVRVDLDVAAPSVAGVSHAAHEPAHHQ